MSSWKVFLQLILRDLLIFKREFAPKFIDTCILFFTNVIVFGYFLQQEGVQEGYAAFFVVGAIAAFGFVEIVGKVGVQLADLEGNKTIYHTLTMPLRSNMVFYYLGTVWAITSMILSALLFPIGKLLVFTEWDLSTISWIRLIPIFITVNLFFGFFSLWLVGAIKNMTNLGSIWLRYIAPMWMFGCYVNSWQAIYSMSPVIGYVSLINPMVYVMEGMRAACLGQVGYLPYWVSLGMLWVFIIACTKHATHRLRAKLDCI